VNAEHAKLAVTLSLLASLLIAVNTVVAVLLMLQMRKSVPSATTFLENIPQVATRQTRPPPDRDSSLDVELATLQVMNMEFSMRTFLRLASTELKLAAARAGQDVSTYLPRQSEIEQAARTRNPYHQRYLTLVDKLRKGYRKMKLLFAEPEEALPPRRIPPWDPFAEPSEDSGSRE